MFYQPFEIPNLKYSWRIKYELLIVHDGLGVTNSKLAYNLCHVLFILTVHLAQYAAVISELKPL